jgi:hypothetical protein
LKTEREIPKPNQKYRHWSGNIYTIVCVANSASDRFSVPIVNYTADSTKYFYRPLDEFLEIIADSDEGTQYYRFERIQESG